MMKWFNKKKKDNKGFTLVELVVVVAILAILVGLLAPQYTKYVERARKSADASNLENMVKAVEVTAGDPVGMLKAGVYKIKINDTKTTVSAESASDPYPAGDGTDGVPAIENAIDEIVSSTARNTALKSKDWGDNNEIYATISIGKDYSTTVVYGPEELLTYIGKNTATTDEGTTSTD